MKPIVSLVILLTALTGCSLVWFSGHEEVKSNADMIQYEYELATVNDETMDRDAQKYCKKLQKYAVRERTERGGYEYETAYRCMPQTNAANGNGLSQGN